MNHFCESVPKDEVNYWLQNESNVGKLLVFSCWKLFMTWILFVFLKVPGCYLGEFLITIYNKFNICMHVY